MHPVRFATSRCSKPNSRIAHLRLYSIQCIERLCSHTHNITFVSPAKFVFVVSIDAAGIECRHLSDAAATIDRRHHWSDSRLCCWRPACSLPSKVSDLPCAVQLYHRAAASSIRPAKFRAYACRSALPTKSRKDCQWPPPVAKAWSFTCKGPYVSSMFYDACCSDQIGRRNTFVPLLSLLFALPSHAVNIITTTHPSCQT